MYADLEQKRIGAASLIKVLKLTFKKTGGNHSKYNHLEHCRLAKIMPNKEMPLNF